MQLETLRRERLEKLNFPHYAPKRAMLEALPAIAAQVALGDTVRVTGEVSDVQKREIEAAAKELIPWRKGPFELFGTTIDTEWQSFIKYNLLKPHLDLKGKRVIDIGCNNGYYLFRMLEEAPAELVGFDPSLHFYLQFLLLNRYIQAPITYELLGIEHLPAYGRQFDVAFCLGVLYHRSDPVTSLKWLASGLKPGGELILDTFMIDGEEEVCLSPKERYSKIPNVYFIPTVPALFNWLERAGFEEIELIATKVTDYQEQRKTSWMQFQSLEDFLDPDDPTRTVEGYPAPKRVYLKARRGDGGR